MLNLPVDVPRLHRVKPPSLLVVARVDVHLHDAVVRHAQELFLFAVHELDHEQRDSVVGQQLPRLDVVHLSVDQRQVFHVGVGFQYPLRQLKTIAYYIMINKKTL